MGSTVYGCSREIASVGVEIISKCPLTHPYPTESPSEYASRRGILAKFGSFSSALKAMCQGNSSPSTWYVRKYPESSNILDIGKPCLSYVFAEARVQARGCPSGGSWQTTWRWKKICLHMVTTHQKADIRPCLKRDSEPHSFNNFRGTKSDASATRIMLLIQCCSAGIPTNLLYKTLQAWQSNNGN